MEQQVANNHLGEVQRGDVLILRVKGKLDKVLSPLVEKKVFQFTSAGQSKVLIDLSEVSYINSCGLRMLLAVKKQIKSVPGKFIICSLRPEVLEMMKICGFDHVFEIAKSEEEALRLF